MAFLNGVRRATALLELFAAGLLRVLLAQRLGRIGACFYVYARNSHERVMPLVLTPGCRALGPPGSSEGRRGHARDTVQCYEWQQRLQGPRYFCRARGPARSSMGSGTRGSGDTRARRWRVRDPDEQPSRTTWPLAHNSVCILGHRGSKPLSCVGPQNALAAQPSQSTSRRDIRLSPHPHQIRIELRNKTAPPRALGLPPPSALPVPHPSHTAARSTGLARGSSCESRGDSDPSQLLSSRTCHSPDRAACQARAAKACDRGGTTCPRLFGAAPRRMTYSTRGHTGAVVEARITREERCQTTPLSEKDSLK